MYVYIYIRRDRDRDRDRERLGPGTPGIEREEIIKGMCGRVISCLDATSYISRGICRTLLNI